MQVSIHIPISLHQLTPQLCLVQTGGDRPLWNAERNKYITHWNRVKVPGPLQEITTITTTTVQMKTVVQQKRPLDASLVPLLLVKQILDL